MDIEQKRIKLAKLNEEMERVDIQANIDESKKMISFLQMFEKILRWAHLAAKLTQFSKEDGGKDT